MAFAQQGWRGVGRPRQPAVEHYKRSRPHIACGGLPPMSHIAGTNNLLVHNI